MKRPKLQEGALVIPIASTRRGNAVVLEEGIYGHIPDRSYGFNENTGPEFLFSLRF